jgi:hypothetical protein
MATVPEHQKNQRKADNENKTVAQSEHPGGAVSGFLPGDDAAPDLRYPHTQKRNQRAAKNEMMKSQEKIFSNRENSDKVKDYLCTPNQWRSEANNQSLTKSGPPEKSNGVAK